MGAGLEDGFFFFFNKKEAQEGFGGGLATSASYLGVDYMHMFSW